MKNDIVVDTNFLNQCVNNNKQVNQDINKAVSEFQGSYLCTCGDAIISRIGPKLSPLYQSLKSVSNNAASYITKYATDAKNLEEVLSGDMSSGMLNDPTSRTQVNSMPKLKKYRMNEPHYNSINRENRSYINKITVNQDNTKYNINKNKSNKPSIGGFIKYLWEDAGYGDKVYSFCESVTNLEKNVGKKIMNFAEKANETKATVEKEAVSIYAKAKSTAKKLSTKEGRQEALDSLSREIEEIKKEATTNVKTIKDKMSTKEGRQEILTEAVKTTVNVINTVHTTKQRVKATGATVFTGIAKGVIKTGEDLRDGLEMLGGSIVNGGIAVVDLAGYAIGKTDANNLRSDKFMKKLSDHVKEDYASEMIEDIETNTGYSKIANYEKENAYGYEAVNGFSEGIGNVAGTMALSAVGAGVVSKFTKVTTAATALDSGVKATKAFTQASTAISFVSGTGRGSQEAYQNGASATSGLIYGLGSGAWEGLQWYTGSKIANYNLTESKIGKKVISKSITAGKKQLINSGARIVLDSVDGAAEGFVQPGLKKIYDKRTYKELYEESGGLQNVIMQGAIGGVMSAGGEVKDIRKAFKVCKAESILNNFPEYLKVVEANKNIEDNIGIDKFEKELSTKKSDIEFDKKIEYSKIHQKFYEQFIDQRFGANQSIVYKVIEAGSPRMDDYFKIVDKYYPKLSEKEKIKMLGSIGKNYSSGGSGGICDYATIVNCVFDNYADNPSEFEKTFGYSMTRVNKAGTVPNDDLMLVDLFCFMNKDKIKEIDGKTLIYENSYKNSINYAENSYINQSFPLIEQWFNSKGANKKVNVNNLFYNGGITPYRKNDQLLETEFKDFFIKEVEGNFKKGNSISMWISPLEPEKSISLKSIINGSNVNVDSGHIMSVIGFLDEDNVIVDSWGSRYSIKITDIPKIGAGLFSVEIR